jgi:hypothetical protein
MTEIPKTIETKYCVYHASFDLAVLVDIKNTLEEAMKSITDTTMYIREIKSINDKVISQKDVYPVSESP